MKPKHHLVAGLLVAAFSTAAVAGSGYQYLNVQKVTQNHSNWCWAAISSDILQWYDAQLTQQCDIVNWAYGRNDACGSHPFNWSSPANTANSLYGRYGSIADILDSHGVDPTADDYAISWNALVNDVNAGEPFVIRFGWAGGGGHFLVGYGYHDLDGTRMIGYMNPWPGEGYTWSTYDWTVRAYNDHAWTHTLETSEQTQYGFPGGWYGWYGR